MRLWWVLRRADFRPRFGLVILLPALGLTIVPPTMAGAIPTTAVVLPSNNATVSGTQYFDATATAGTTEVQFELSGNGLSDYIVATATPTIYGWLAAVDTTDFYNGTYTLQSVATGGGASGTSLGISVTFSNPIPSSHVVLPANGATVSGQFYMDAVASSGATVNFLFSGGPDNWSPRTMNPASPTIYGWISDLNTPLVPGGMPNGIYTLQSQACIHYFVCYTSEGISINVSN